MTRLRSETPSWVDINQRHMAAALRRVRGHLEALSAGARATEGVPADVPSMPAGFPPVALDQLAAAFGLSRFELDVLVLCAGVEMDGTMAQLCGAVARDSARAYPTFALALTALPNAHWSALAPGAPLRHWRLIEMVNRSGLVSSQLRIDERVLHFLAGIDGMDERLASLVEPAEDGPSLTASRVRLSNRIAHTWSDEDARPPLVHLCGGDGDERRAILAHACHSANLRLWVLAAALVPTSPSEADDLARLWSREARLGRHGLLIELDEGADGDEQRYEATFRFAGRVQGPVVIGGGARVQSVGQRTVRVAIDKPSAVEQAQAWQHALGPAAAGLNGCVEHVVAQFSLGAAAIGRVTRDACRRAEEDPRLPLDRALWESCRAHTRPRLDDLAQRLEPGPTWDDLVVPDGVHQLLREIVTHVRHRATVYERWGFARAGTRGLGVTVLFSGASGTGKTMAAEVLARELSLDLYRVDLAGVVSKYIGETEKNLRRIFDVADDGGAILLFDEADALFGKRSEVRDSHDRFANIEVSYLLQRMEAYRGLAILTTNQRQAMDVAFIRRLRFIVQFPFPDRPEREEIWRRAFPSGVPSERLASDSLSQLTLSGAGIRNVALGAAFAAAESAERVAMGHVLRAARSEYGKMDKPLTDAETAGWSGVDDADHSRHAIPPDAHQDARDS